VQRELVEHSLRRRFAEPAIRPSSLLLEMLAEKLDDRIRIPLLDVESLLHVAVLVDELDGRIRAAHVRYLQSRPGVSVFRIDERLYLRESTNFSSAYFHLGHRIELRSTLLEFIFRTTALTGLDECLEMKLRQVFAASAEQIRCVAKCSAFFRAGVR